jgi:hypothetical protein
MLISLGTDNKFYFPGSPFTFVRVNFSNRDVIDMNNNYVDISYDLIAAMQVALDKNSNESDEESGDLLHTTGRAS